MSGLSVLAFPDARQAAARLAAALSAPFDLIDLHEFPDGETLPTAPAVPTPTVVFYARLDRPNARLMPLLQAADALRRAGARRLILVAPYLCYMRQDAVFRTGQPLSRDVLGALLGGAFDRLVTVNAHLHRTAELSQVFGRPVDNLDVAGHLVRRLAPRPGDLIVGPDIESAPWIHAAATTTGCEAMTFIKTRQGDRRVTLILAQPARVKGRRAILLDDICSSGVTLQVAAGQLLAAGATSVDLAVIHPMFDAATEAALVAAGAGRIVSTDSIPHPTNALELAAGLALALQDETRP